jgi:hypothetical protein
MNCAAGLIIRAGTRIKSLRKVAPVALSISYQGATVSLATYGMADPNNDGCALLDFDSTDDEEEAARWADDVARRYAEEESQYQASWRAGNNYSELGERIKEHRGHVIALCQEARKARTLGDSFPTICNTIREAVASHLKDMSNARDKRAKILDGYWNEAAFKDGAAS